MSLTIKHHLTIVVLGEEPWYEHTWTMRDFEPDEEFDPILHFWVSRSVRTKSTVVESQHRIKARLELEHAYLQRKGTVHVKYIGPNAMFKDVTALMRRDGKVQMNNVADDKMYTHDWHDLGPMTHWKRI